MAALTVAVVTANQTIIDQATRELGSDFTVRPFTSIAAFQQAATERDFLKGLAYACISDFEVFPPAIHLGKGIMRFSSEPHAIPGVDLIRQVRKQDSELPILGLTSGESEGYLAFFDMMQGGFKRFAHVIAWSSKAPVRGFHFGTYIRHNARRLPMPAGR